MFLLPTLFIACVEHVFCYVIFREKVWDESGFKVWIHVFLSPTRNHQTTSISSTTGNTASYTYVHTKQFPHSSSPLLIFHSVCFKNSKEKGLTKPGKFILKPLNETTSRRPRWVGEVEGLCGGRCYWCTTQSASYTTRRRLTQGFVSAILPAGTCESHT